MHVCVKTKDFNICMIGTTEYTYGNLHNTQIQNIYKCYLLNSNNDSQDLFLNN